MPENIKKNDLRVLKSHRALSEAMFALLKSRNFNQITVNDLCAEAQISRSTFYAHFADKFDFLRHWLLEIAGEGAARENLFFQENKIAMRNLIENAGSEANELLCDFLFALLEIDIGAACGEGTGTRDAVMCSICRGGAINYLSWQMKHRFPAELPVVNPHIRAAFASFFGSKHNFGAAI